MKKIITLIIFVNIIVFTSLSQSKNLNFKLKSTSVLTLNGTSTLHDWQSNVQQTKGDLSITSDLKIISLEVSANVLDIKSKSSTMDKKIYKAFDSKLHPKINFELLKHATKNQLSGIFTAGGISKKILINSNIETQENHIYLKGKFSIKMTEYNIKPPKFMLGLFKTGDEIVIEYNFIFTPINYTTVYTY